MYNLMSTLFPLFNIHLKLIVSVLSHRKRGNCKIFPLYPAWAKRKQTASSRGTATPLGVVSRCLYQADFANCAPADQLPAPLCSYVRPFLLLERGAHRAANIKIIRQTNRVEGSWPISWCTVSAVGLI